MWISQIDLKIDVNLCIFYIFRRECTLHFLCFFSLERLSTTLHLYFKLILYHSQPYPWHCTCKDGMLLVGDAHGSILIIFVLFRLRNVNLLKWMAMLKFETWFCVLVKKSLLFSYFRKWFGSLDKIRPRSVTLTPSFPDRVPPPPQMLFPNT